MRWKSWLGCGLLTGILCLVLLRSHELQEGMSRALHVCLETMIPSLYAMLIGAELLHRTGTDRLLARLLEVPARWLLHTNGTTLLIFLLSQVAGYPIGARLLCTHAAQHRSRRDRSWLAGCCFGGGPAFFSAVFAASDCGNTLYCRAFVSGVAVNGLLFWVVCRVLPVPETAPKAQGDAIAERHTFAAALVTATAAGARALYRICGMVLLFGGLLALLDATGCTAWIAGLLPFCHVAPDVPAQWLRSFAEISQLTACTPIAPGMLPLAAAALSFGGVCIFLQIAALSEGTLCLLPIVTLRCLAALLTAGLCCLWNFLAPIPSTVQAVAVFQQLPPDVQTSGNPVPAVFLLIMSVLLLRMRPGIPGKAA